MNWKKRWHETDLDLKSGEHRLTIVLESHKRQKFKCQRSCQVGSIYHYQQICNFTPLCCWTSPFISFYPPVSPRLVTCQLAPTSQLFTIMLYRDKTPDRHTHMWAFLKQYPHYEVHSYQKKTKQRQKNLEWTQKITMHWCYTGHFGLCRKPKTF